MDVRRGTARLAAVLLLSGTGLVVSPVAWAQEAPPSPEASDPCAPGPDGSVPEMCQGGMAPEPEPAEPGTEPCPPQPVEPGDGVVTDEGEQGVAEGEPHPDAEPASEEPRPEPAAEEPRQEPAPDEPVSSGPDADGEEGVVCAFAVPISAPVDTAAGGAAAPEAAAPGGAGNGAVAAGQLPRTGPHDRLLAATAVGSALLVLGAGAAAAGRRRAA